MMTLTQPKPYVLFEQLLAPELLERFAKESIEQMKTAEVHELFQDFPLEERGGHPKRKLRSAPGGAVQDAIYHSDKLLRTLEEATGYTIKPTGRRGTYSYYTNPNDFLDIHRDINRCDLTLLTCLHSTIPADSPSAALYMYTQRLDESLPSIYQDRLRGYETIQLGRGQSVLIEGGRVPHGVNPIRGDDQRIISALCYRRY